jgi:hypothetical protein
MVLYAGPPNSTSRQYLVKAFLSVLSHEVPRWAYHENVLPVVPHRLTRYVTLDVFIKVANSDVILNGVKSFVLRNLQQLDTKFIIKKKEKLLYEKKKTFGTHKT